MTPTSEQQRILDASGDTVIIANPGSGKTFVLSEKIKLILPNLIQFKGVIAISYTNKASQELRNRCLKTDVDPKGSFFGTMDRFYLSEIIMPFGKHLFGLPKKSFIVIKKQDLPEEKRKFFLLLEENLDIQNLSSEFVKAIKELFLSGEIILEYVGILSIFVFDNSLSCKRYLKARYTHIIIDEYQDSGIEQHLLFLRIKMLGLSGIAVGDANQSIFKFSGKSSEYLLDLAKRTGEFDLFALDFNHRCHPSIINYSLLLLNEKSVPLQCSEIHVLEKNISGSEKEIATWLSKQIPVLFSSYKLDGYNKIGILVRSARTGQIIHDFLSLPNKYFESTRLDDDFTIWSDIFRKLLAILFDVTISKTDFIESFSENTLPISTIKDVLRKISQIQELIKDLSQNIETVINEFEIIAKTLSPNSANSSSSHLLREILSNTRLLNLYKPAHPTEIQLMTLHKSKGLEFDMVFHLDLYQWILPMYNGDKIQDLNLHYVGITRAKKCCVLCHSTKRTNSGGTIVSADRSEFLDKTVLLTRRIPCPV